MMTGDGASTENRIRVLSITLTLTFQVRLCGAKTHPLTRYLVMMMRHHWTVFGALNFVLTFPPCASHSSLAYKYKFIFSDHVGLWSCIIIYRSCDAFRFVQSIFGTLPWRNIQVVVNPPTIVTCGSNRITIKSVVGEVWNKNLFIRKYCSWFLLHRLHRYFLKQLQLANLP